MDPGAGASSSAPQNARGTPFDTQIQGMRAQLQGTRAPPASTVVVVGRAGKGKSSVINHIVDALRVACKPPLPVATHPTVTTHHTLRAHPCPARLAGMYDPAILLPASLQAYTAGRDPPSWHDPMELSGLVPTRRNGHGTEACIQIDPVVGLQYYEVEMEVKSPEHVGMVLWTAGEAHAAWVASNQEQGRDEDKLAGGLGLQEEDFQCVGERQVPEFLEWGKDEAWVGQGQVLSLCGAGTGAGVSCAGSVV